MFRVELLGAFSAQRFFQDHELWRAISYQFLHANVGHLFLNMWCLWIFGPILERQFGGIRFLIYYLTCGIAAALFSSALGYWGFWGADQWAETHMVGASGAIYGVIAACTVLSPRDRIMLIFPPIEMTLKTFSIVVLGIALLIIAMDWNNAGGEAGHMGGMLMGFLIMSIRAILKRQAAYPLSPQHPTHNSWSAPPVRPTASQVDDILDKISQHGIDSLTDEEREVLVQVSKYGQRRE